MLDWKRWSREGEQTEYKDQVVRTPGWAEVEDRAKNLQPDILMSGAYESHR